MAGLGLRGLRAWHQPVRRRRNDAVPRLRDRRLSRGKFMPVTLKTALGEHWPEYLIEAWALGSFMVSAGVVATLLGAPDSPVHRAIAGAIWRNVAGGVAMGLTAIALIHSGWGKRSGAHMNPAVTLTFLRLGKIRPWDALFFVFAQTLGGTAGVLLVAALFGHAFTDPPVSYAATLPGPQGPGLAFSAEVVISAFLILILLSLSSSARFARFTGFAAGCLVATYISFEAPLSGMSMNPARSFASAAPGMQWQYFWIYLTAPVLGMLTGAEIFLVLTGARRALCAKLLHPLDVRRVVHDGQYLSREPWLDGHGNPITPEEHFNVGGKTKWYGAALLRFSAREFLPEAPYACLGWPISLNDLTPYYEQAERLLGVRPFDCEPDLAAILDRLQAAGSAWQSSAMPMGLSAD